MGSTRMQNQFKLNQVLETFLQKDCQIKQEIYFNRLLTHLSSAIKTDYNGTTGNILSEWLQQAVAKWEITECPSPHISSFTINLASLLSENEFKFNELNKTNLYQRLINVLKARQLESTPSIKLGYIKLLLSFLDHRSGNQWIINNDNWEDVLRLILSNQTVYITREGQKFMCKLLKEIIDQDEDFCRNVTKKILLPLNDDSYKSIISEDVCDENLLIQLNPTLQLIINIMEYLLECVMFPKKVATIFLNDFKLKESVFNMMRLAHSPEFVFEIGKVFIIVELVRCYLIVATDKYNVQIAEESINIMTTFFKQTITRGHYENVMKLCHYVQHCWNIVGYKIPQTRVSLDKEPVVFAGELVAIQILPIFIVVARHYKNFQIDEGDELRDRYVHKLFQLMSEKTIRMGYLWRDCLLRDGDNFMIGLKALQNLLKSRKYFPRERATLVFQSLIYTLKDLVSIVYERPDKLGIFAKEENFLLLLFDTLIIFIEEFHITWRDSVETICVMGGVVCFLGFPTWPSSVVVKALKLAKVAIHKYMSPSLTLLVDGGKDSTITTTGPLLYAKLHDPSWEVRDTALEVVCIISHLCSTKFPSLQQVLLDSELPTLVLKMSTCDSESFVRATSIKCLQEMIKVEEIYDNVLKTKNLTDAMIQILHNETEGIVRVEAATFICIAYEQQKYPIDSLDKIHETMIHASTTDLHWEVKVRSLTFWEQVIKNQLQNQGMIDGAFPSVTFSKENRKIVTLTDGEIKKRLHKVLQHLSSIGCLGVLTSAIEDDCDMEVSKTAVEITQKLTRLLKMYHLQKDCSVPVSPAPTENETISSGVSVDESMIGSPLSSNNSNNEEIIDQIVNSFDMNLLKSVYAPSDYGSVENYGLGVKRVVSPSAFLDFVQQDLNAVMAEKKNWLNGIEDLGSLLDDMLKTYDDNVNSMDCY